MVKRRHFFVTAMVALFALGSVAAVAQDQRARPGRNPEQILEDLKKQLELNEDQAKKIENILEEFGKKREKLFSQDMERSEKREQMGKLLDEQTKEIMLVLNKDQQKKYQKMLDEREKRMRSRRENAERNR